MGLSPIVYGTGRININCLRWITVRCSFIPKKLRAESLLLEVLEVVEVFGQNPNLLIFGKTFHPTFASSKKWSISFAIDGAEI